MLSTVCVVWNTSDTDQTDNHMGKQESHRDQQRRFPQQHDRQNNHVSEVECLTRKEDGVFARRMFRAFQIIVGREEKAREVPHKHIVERKHRVKKQSIDMLEPLHAQAGFVGRKAKDAASRKRVVFTVEIDAGVVAPMMKDTPHVRVDSANIENIVQGFVYGPHRRDGVVVAVVRDVQQKECLGEAVQKIEGDKLP